MCVCEGGAGTLCCAAAPCCETAAAAACAEAWVRRCWVLLMLCLAAEAWVSVCRLMLLLLCHAPAAAACLQVGGLGDVVTGLARACLARGHNVEVMLPVSTGAEGV